MSKRRYGLRLQLICFCVMILVVSLLLQVVFNLFFAKSLALMEKEGQIERLYTALVTDYTDDQDRIYDIVSQVQDVENLRVEISGPEGVIFSTSPIANRGQFVPPEFEPQRIDPKAESDHVMVQLSQTIEYAGEYRSISIWSSVAAIDTSVRLFTQSSIIVSLVVLMLGLLWVVYFTSRLTRPIFNMDKVAQNVANLRFDQRADEAVVTAELNSLAVSINTMSENLEQMIDKLNADNQDLTVQVEQHQKMEQMRRQFIANISHEMKTPLSMLMMYSESLREDIPGIDKAYYCDTIIQEAAGLNAMVGQLLDISSIENGLQQLDCHGMDLSAFVTALLEKQAPLFQKRQLVGEITADLWCNGDEKYLEQALNNYLSNALNHSQEGDTIMVRLERVADGLCVTVENPGKPIAEEDMPHLWDSFYRADKSRAQQGEKRVGLGLYIVKTCIQAHGGHVAVANGTETVAFSFTVPSLERL